MNEPTAGRPQQFLASLAAAMHATAESARESSVAQCQTSVDEYVAEIRERAGAEVAGLRKIAADDVAVIRDQSKTQAQHVRDESERRVARRQTLLEEELAELQKACDFELLRVKQRTDAFEARLRESFDELVGEVDPTIFATLASQMPDPPYFGEPDPAAIVRELREPAASPSPATKDARSASRATAGSAANGPSEPADGPAPKAALPDHWWLDSPAKLATIAEASSGSSR